MAGTRPAMTVQADQRDGRDKPSHDGGSWPACRDGQPEQPAL